MLETIRKKLLEELSQYDAHEAEMISNALELAEKTHTGQYRRPRLERPDHRDPYIIHPMRVALVLMNEVGMRSPEAVAGALLHDVVEDSEGRVTEEDILRQFGDEIAVIVSLLSKPPESTEVPRHEQLAVYHKNIAEASPKVRMVKLADRLDNIRELLLVSDYKRQLKYLKETREIFLPLAAATSPFFHSQLAGICDRLENMLSVSSECW